MGWEERTIIYYYIYSMKDKIIAYLDKFPRFQYRIDEKEGTVAVTRNTKDGIVTLNMTKDDDLEATLLRELVLPYL